MHIVISRTDGIGDTVLTLPMAGLIKERYPQSTITFIGRSYTRDIVVSSKYIDQFLNWDDYRNSEFESVKILKSLQADWILHVFPDKQIADSARKAGIPDRVGTAHKIYHWFNCNHRLNFSRRRSNLHEAQLNCKLLEPLHIKIPSLDSFLRYYGLRVLSGDNNKIDDLLAIDKKNLVLHPKSKGSAREWGLDNFQRLIDLLSQDQFRIFITGSAGEAELMQSFLQHNQGKVYDVTGRFTLSELLTFLSKVDAIVAASTGPLHIAAALGTTAIGIYPPLRPMFPTRWAPLGANAEVLVIDKQCSDCIKSKDCHCIRDVLPKQIFDKLVSRFL